MARSAKAPLYQCPHELRMMKDRAERAEADRDALKKDAERYRWIRTSTFDQLGTLIDLRTKWLDAAIDAAMKEKS